MKKFQFAISGGPWHGWPYLIYSQRTFLIIFTFFVICLVGRECFFESNFPDILISFDTNLGNSVDSSNFSGAIFL